MAAAGKQSDGLHYLDKLNAVTMYDVHGMLGKFNDVDDA
jgi:hypothetical protein